MIHTLWVSTISFVIGLTLEMPSWMTKLFLFFGLVCFFISTIWWENQKEKIGELQDDVKGLKCALDELRYKDDKEDYEDEAR